MYTILDHDCRCTGDLQKALGGVFIVEHSDRTNSYGFKLKEGKFRSDIRKNFFTYEGGEALGQVAQRNCGCPNP